MTGLVKLNSDVLTRDYMILDQLKQRVNTGDVLDVIFQSYKVWVQKGNIKALQKMEELDFFSYFSNRLLLSVDGVNKKEVMDILKRNDVLD
jgi:hypothetical protein